MRVRVGAGVGGTFTDFVLFDQASGQLREFELASTRGLDGKKLVHTSCIMQHLQRVLTSSAGRNCGAGQAAGRSRIGQRLTVAGVSHELTRSLDVESYILHRASLRCRLGESGLSGDVAGSGENSACLSSVSCTVRVARSPRRRSRDAAERRGKRRW